MADPTDNDTQSDVYSNPVDQLHSIQDSAAEVAAENPGHEIDIANEVANDFYDWS